MREISRPTLEAGTTQSSNDSITLKITSQVLLSSRAYTYLSRTKIPGGIVIITNLILKDHLNIGKKGSELPN